MRTGGLDPSGEEGRDLLRRELLRSEYQQENPVQRLLRWLEEQLDAGLSAASSLPPLVALAAMVVLLALAVGVIWLVSRARLERARTRERAGVLDDVVARADDVRAAAESALAAGRHDDALLDAFRALALRQVEAGRLDDLPGATAREIAATLATDHPRLADDAAAAAGLFDAVLYGGRPAQREEVRAVLGLDDVLAGVR